MSGADPGAGTAPGVVLLSARLSDRLTTLAAGAVDATVEALTGESVEARSTGLSSSGLITGGWLGIARPPATAPAPGLAAPDELVGSDGPADRPELPGSLEPGEPGDDGVGWSGNDDDEPGLSGGGGLSSLMGRQEHRRRRLIRMAKIDYLLLTAGPQTGAAKQPFLRAVSFLVECLA
jgi:hypothetical protein